MRGFQAHRLKDNPEEKRFAEAWAKERVLRYLLQDPKDQVRATPPDPSELEEQVAASVIQWLGSPVGQHFLEELGYKKVG